MFDFQNQSQLGGSLCLTGDESLGISSSGDPRHSLGHEDFACLLCTDCITVCPSCSALTDGAPIIRRTDC